MPRSHREAPAGEGWGQGLPNGAPPAQVLVAFSPGLCLSCQEPEGAGAKSPMCQKLSPKWCFLDGEWPLKGRVPPRPLAVLGGAAGDLGLDRGPPSSASPLPTATTASRFYRIDRAQVSTQGLLRKPLAPGPHVTCPVWPPCMAGHTRVHRWAVHRDGADSEKLGSRGWVVGEPQSTGIFQPDTEGKVLWVRDRGTR